MEIDWLMDELSVTEKAALTSGSAFWYTAAMARLGIITGSDRGVSVYIATAACAAGHKVVATGRPPETGRAAIGGAGDPREVS